MRVGRNHPLRLQLAGYWLYCWKGQADSPIYTERGGLLNGALYEKVQRQYDEMMAASRVPAHRVSRVSQWLDAIGRLIARLGDSIDVFKARLYAVLLALGLVVVLLFVLGFISFDQLQQFFRTIAGGS